MNRQDLLGSYECVREMSERICKPLVTEDYVIQSTTDVSPPKWHLGHTSWFFEQVILNQFIKHYRPHNERFYFIFNSYYQSFGERLARDIRGTLSRPTVKEIYDYRSAIDSRMRSLLEQIEGKEYDAVARLVELGLHHEQQHQELLVTDIKHIFASNPVRPIYRTLNGVMAPSVHDVSPAVFLPIEGGVFELGAPENGFAWDNERPRHKVLTDDFTIMNRLVTCGEFLEFINDGGYRNPLVWLSDGWDVVTREHWEAPLYWRQSDGVWTIMTLGGERPMNLNEPVAHVSFYEATAYARWADKRLPTEAEWERAASTMKASPAGGNFLEDDHLHPIPLRNTAGAGSQCLAQMFGDVWEWTASAYLPYPGYKQERGPLGEYNGKFMSNQMILRGGSCATPRSHIRLTYRNFFQGEKRWQFTGIRLASDKG